MARHLNDHDYELLSAYLDGLLAGAERAALEARLEAEPELRRELDGLRETVALIRALPPVKAPRSFALDARMARPARLWLFPTSTAFSAFSAAAAALLLALGLLALLPSLDLSPAPAAAPVQMALQPTGTDAPDAAPPPDESRTLDDQGAALGVIESLAQQDMAMPAIAAEESEHAAEATIGRAAIAGTPPSKTLTAPPDVPLAVPPVPMLENLAQPTGPAELLFEADDALLLPESLPGAAIMAQPLEPEPTGTPAPPPITPAPTLASVTGTPAPPLTVTITPAPTLVPVTGTPDAPASNALGAGLLAAGGLLLALAAATTLARRRARR